ncbi:hypothetical protein BKA66DRAFT_453863 [Pyrenochaeta sp. MPI-SDFR-AT-0127]|nr:hypothetical protein BKA66DRAFT_453863 [Pyrenochaeta sp. MPI-SDFR-AT-0127]
MQSFTLRSGNIPGLNQLKAIRTALAALAKKIGFGEKVLNYHKFLCSLTSKQSDPYLAIPVATDIASIIRMLYKIVSSEEPYIFICWGI